MLKGSTTVKVILTASTYGQYYKTSEKLIIKCTMQQAMTTLLPPKWIVLNKDKATTRLQMFLKPTTPVLTPQGLDIYASSICQGDG